MMRCRQFTLEEARALRRRVRVPACVSDRWWREALNVELEHADVTKCSPLLTARIASRHTRERGGCHYYPRLARYVER